MSSIQRSPSYHYEFTVPADVIDVNGHVNNVAYVNWMQDLAVHHARDTGGTAATQAHGCTWVAREHRIEYLAPCYEGDGIKATTWVENFRRVQSLRKYEFVRLTDRKLVARGETNWVLVDAKSGRPKAIPETVRACFLLKEA